MSWISTPSSAALMRRTAVQVAETLSIPFSSACCMISSAYASALKALCLGCPVGLGQRESFTNNGSLSIRKAASSLLCRSAINLTAVASETRIASKPSFAVMSLLSRGSDSALIFSKLIGALRWDSSPVRTNRRLRLWDSRPSLI